jgi:FdhD protein
VETHEPGAVPHAYWLIEGNRSQVVNASIIEESRVSIYVNGQELATIMCSPMHQEALALGFLFNEGIIQSVDEIGLIQANLPRTTVDVFLKRTEFNPPRRLIITSGCGGGVTLVQLTESYPALASEYDTTPDVLLRNMKELRGVSHLYNQTRGIHTSALANEEGILISAEDVGRHNTIDKIAGKALQAAIDMSDCMLLTSGRISSEMLNKARRMEIPLVVSRTAPTSITVQLAQAWDICVVGYVRQNRMRVYTHPQRLGLGKLAVRNQ